MKALVTLALILLAPPAWASCPNVAAGDAAHARADYADGERHYAAGRYRESVAAFEAALAASGRADLYFNLANAHERLGDRARAAELLELYVACVRPEDADLVAERARRLRDAAVPMPLERDVCPVEEPRILAGGLELGTRADLVRRARPRRRASHPTRWLAAGGAALATAAALTLLAVTTDRPDGCGDGDARPCGQATDWRPILTGAAAVTAAAGVAAITVGVVFAID